MVVNGDDLEDFCLRFPWAKAGALGSKGSRGGCLDASLVAEVKVAMDATLGLLGRGTLEVIFP